MRSSRTLIGCSQPGGSLCPESSFRPEQPVFSPHFAAAGVACMREGQPGESLQPAVPSAPCLPALSAKPLSGAGRRKSTHGNSLSLLPPAHPAKGKAGGVACHVYLATGFPASGGGGVGEAPAAPRHSGRPRGDARSCPHGAPEGRQGVAASCGVQRGPILSPRAPLFQGLGSGAADTCGRPSRPRRPLARGG